MITPKHRATITLAAKGGNNADAVLLDEIYKVDEKVDVVDKKVETVIAQTNDAFANIKLKKGDKGDSPSKQELLNLIEPLIPEPIKGDDGKTPIPGVDFLLPKDGRTPIAGVDFPLPKDGETPSEQELISLIKPLIPVVKDGSPDSGEAIVGKINELPTDQDELKIDAAHIKNLPEATRQVIQRAGWGAHPLVIEQAGVLKAKIARLLNFKGTGAPTITQNPDGSTDLDFSGGGGSGTPASPDTSVQFNDGGSFGGSANFTYDKSTNTLSIGGNVTTIQALLADIFSISSSYGSINLNTDGIHISASGTNGNFFVTSLVYKLISGLSGIGAILDTSLLSSSDKTFSFPNQTGTFLIVDSGGSVYPTSALYFGETHTSSGFFTDIYNDGVNDLVLHPQLNHLAIQDGTSAKKATFGTSSLTADKTYTFPNASGNFQIAGVTAFASGTTLDSSLSGTTVTNTGASGLAVFNLPASSVGLMYTFVITDADGLEIVANGTDLLYIGDAVSTAGGNIQATAIGNSITIQCVAPGMWATVASAGTWSLN